MTCERCNQKSVSVIYRESIGGRERSLRLCGECADALEAAGELEDVSAAVAGMTAPRFPSEESRFTLPLRKPTAANGTTPAAVPCPLCGSTAEELAATGRVGCAACYTLHGKLHGELHGERHGGLLESVIRAAHGRAEHTGRVSAGYRARRERETRLAGMRQQLKEAVSREDYESAADLRDGIRRLEAEL
jgi:protein arginine kinase activator